METTRSWQTKDAHNRLSRACLCTNFQTRNSEELREWEYSGLGTFLVTTTPIGGTEPTGYTLVSDDWVLTPDNLERINSEIYDDNGTLIEEEDLILLRYFTPVTGEFYHYSGSIHDPENRELHAIIFGSSGG